MEGLTKKTSYEQKLFQVIYFNLSNDAFDGIFPVPDI